MTPLIFSCKSLPIKLIKLLLLPLKTMHEGVLASYNKFIVVILSLSICSLSLSLSSAGLLHCTILGKRPHSYRTGMTNTTAQFLSFLKCKHQHCYMNLVSVASKHVHVRKKHVIIGCKHGMFCHKTFVFAQQNILCKNFQSLRITSGSKRNMSES